MKKSSGYGWHLVLVNCTLKIVKSECFMLCVFYIINKDMMTNIFETKTQKHSVLQIPHLIFTISMKIRCALKVHLSFGWLKPEKNSNQMTGLNGPSRLKNWGRVGNTQWGKGTKLPETSKATGSQNGKRWKVFCFCFWYLWLASLCYFTLNKSSTSIGHPTRKKQVC